MSERQGPCPKCGQDCDLARRLCPNCGALLDALSSWPPAPTGLESKEATLAPTLLNHSKGADLAFGVVVGLVGFAAIAMWGLGLIVLGAALMRLRKYGYVCRGIGIGVAVWIVILLGAFIICTSTSYFPSLERRM